MLVATSSLVSIECAQFCITGLMYPRGPPSLTHWKEPASWKQIVYSLTSLNFSFLTCKEEEKYYLTERL